MSNKYVESNTPLNYKIPFVVDGDLVSPSAATITLTKNDGSVVGGINDTALTIGSGATFALYTIIAANNVASLDYDIRYIKVKFTYQSKDYYISDYYIVQAGLTLPVTPNDVRAFGGFSDVQVHDEQIDVYQAFNQLQADVTQENLRSLLAAGSSLIPYIQVGIKAKALINSLIAMEVTVPQSEQADNTNYKLFPGVDFNGLLLRINQAYNQAVGKLNGTLPLDAPFAVIFITATGTDPVTGV